MKLNVENSHFFTSIFRVRNLAKGLSNRLSTQLLNIPTVILSVGEAALAHRSLDCRSTCLSNRQVSLIKERQSSAPVAKPVRVSGLCVCLLWRRSGCPTGLAFETFFFVPQKTFQSSMSFFHFVLKVHSERQAPPPPGIFA
jgi:hypothetical protein